jgi:hypothetical protein
MRFIFHFKNLLQGILLKVPIITIQNNLLNIFVK